MDIAGEYRIAADRERVWRALNDPAMLRDCIPGCESLEKTGAAEYKGRVVAAVGPVRATFATRITLENLQPPASYRIAGESKAGAAGFGKGHADVTLVDDGGATLLRYVAEFRVGGKLAQVGSRLVQGATRKTADEFFGNLSRALDPGAAGGSEPVAAPSSRARAAFAVVAGIGLLLLLWLLLR